jgi:sugar-specific transcriptional regulator TrmB
MSLKDFTKEVFTRYGLTEEMINVYLAFLRIPRATISQAYMYLNAEAEINNETLDADLAKIVEITDDLVGKGFLKKIEGIVDRYIPLEPFFELFTKESGLLRGEISKIKDTVLADQSTRFETLEGIQDNSINEITDAVSTQVNDFFVDSDKKDSDKKEKLEAANKRLTDTLKTLESDLHGIVEKDYSEFNKDIDELDAEVNTELDKISENHNKSTKALESNIHNIFNTLNGNIKKISQDFVTNSESGLTSFKDDINKIIEELLADFGDRVSKLETELKKDLDAHVDHHKDKAADLKPLMEKILEKYLDRMDKVVTDLKDRIDALLNEHISTLDKTSSQLEGRLSDNVDKRHTILKNQVKKFKETTLTLMDNLIDISTKLSDLADELASRGSAFKALFAGKHKKYVAINQEVQERVGTISDTLKEDFGSSTDKYVEDTQKTTNDLKGDIGKTVKSENTTFKKGTTDLNDKAQNTINAELESLASELSAEVEDTINDGVNHCSETSLKLKDSLETSLHQHHDDYNKAITVHNETTIKHYDDSDAEVKRQNESFVKDMDTKFSGAVADTTSEVETQTTDINNHRDNSKKKQRQIFDNRLKKIRTDFDGSKSNTSAKIDAEIKFFDKDSTDLDKNLHDMLEDHKNKYKENATTLQNSLSNTVRDTTQNVKDAIADFTLQFMNSIDDANELAENNEEKLSEIHKASSAIPEISKTSTWHTIGIEALVAAIKDTIFRTKSSIIIVTPVVIPQILQLCSQIAFEKKAARFLLTSHWDLNRYGDIITKMKGLGNIQFRQLKSQGDFYACTRDAEEVILAPAAKKDENIVSVISEEEGYAQLYSQFIGPIFQANSRPI